MKFSCDAPPLRLSIADSRAKLCHALPTSPTARQESRHNAANRTHSALRSRGAVRGGALAGRAVGVCANEPGRRDREIPGRRPRAAADRGRQAGKGADLLFVDPDRRHCRAGRRLRQEIRRQGQGLARRLRGHPATHFERGQGPALRGRRHGRVELGARAALSREPAAGGEIALSRRPHSGRRCRGMASGRRSISIPSCKPTTPIW